MKHLSSIGDKSKILFLMHWYYIIFIGGAYAIGIYLHMRYKEYRKNSHLNNSWKRREK